jgi:hypothetical protein
MQDGSAVKMRRFSYITLRLWQTIHHLYREIFGHQLKSWCPFSVAARMTPARITKKEYSRSQPGRHSTENFWQAITEPAIPASGLPLKPMGA